VNEAQCGTRRGLIGQQGPPKSTLALYDTVGDTAVRKSMPRPTLQGTQTPFKSSKSTSSDSAKDNTTRGARLPSELMLFLNTSQLLFRRTPSWWTRPNLGWTCGAQDKSSDTSKDAPPELATRAWRVIHHSYNSYIKKKARRASCQSPAPLCGASNGGWPFRGEKARTGRSNIWTLVGS